MADDIGTVFTITEEGGYFTIDWSQDGQSWNLVQNLSGQESIDFLVTEHWDENEQVQQAGVLEALRTWDGGH